MLFTPDATNFGTGNLRISIVEISRFQTKRKLSRTISRGLNSLKHRVDFRPPVQFSTIKLLLPYANSFLSLSLSLFVQLSNYLFTLEQIPVGMRLEHVAGRWKETMGIASIKSKRCIASMRWERNDARNRWKKSRSNDSETTLSKKKVAWRSVASKRDL